MESVLCWNILIFVTIAICSPVNGAPSELECSDSNLRIIRGNFTLSGEYKDGSILRYQCLEGYYPSPVKQRICSNGKWVPAPTKQAGKIECKKITCPNPKVMENGDVEPYQVFYYVNDITTYVCHSDYTLRGSSTRICQLNGKWNGSTPICSRNSDHCPDPGTPPGAFREGTIFNIDDKVSYRCDDKLKLLGSRERVCQDDGTWSGQEPECYADFTYDTPEEAAQAFGGTLKTTLTKHEKQDQSARKIRLNRKGNLNIYIALDASDSITKQDFDKAKESFIILMDNIRRYEVFPNYEILIFATHVTRIVRITDHYGKNKDDDEKLYETREKLEDFKFESKGDKSGTNIAKAYEEILESISLVKAINYTLFNETQHVIIMFTDGIPNMGGNPTQKVNLIKQAVYDGDEKKREQYLDLYVFGVGQKAVDASENVIKWTTQRPNEKHLFLLKDMNDVQKTLDEMLDDSTSVGLCGLYKDVKDDSKEYPWMIKFSFSHNGEVQKCLGSLVTPIFILTAAHCFQLMQKVDVKNINFEIPTGAKAKNVMLHPKYHLREKVSERIKEYYVNDVALIELEKPVIFDVKLRPICIPCTKETSGALRLSGSGVTCQKHKETLLSKKYEDAFFMSSEKNGDVFPKQKVQIKLKEKLDACIEPAETALNVSADTVRTLVAQNFLCTGGLGHNNQLDENVCKGDSGGATFVQKMQRAIQVGIVSWGLQNVCKDMKSYKNINLREKARDFHVDLFSPDVQNFLKKYLGDKTIKYNVALHFL